MMITNESLLTARFPGLEAELVDEMLAKGKILEVDAAETLMQAGQPITSTMLVLDGRVKIYREDDQGNEFLMYYLEPGNACAFSIMCALNNEASQITAVTETEATLLAIPFHESIAWMRKYGSWDEFVLRNYRHRFEELLLTLDHIAFRSMDERLAFYLKRRVDAEGHDLQVSHQEIARDLNTAREVVSRLLKKLEQRGAVRLERNHIHVLKPEGLL
jgi:CRP/FNR family transcriptional regulator